MSNKTKATHKGSCQCCGRLQMLPEGKLSKHGYAVAGYGYFVGVCRGAKYLPFEQSKDQVERYIREAQEVEGRFLESIAEYSTPTEGSKAMYHEYRRYDSNRRMNGYHWVEIELVVVATHHAEPWTYNGVTHPAYDYYTFGYKNYEDKIVGLNSSGDDNKSVGARATYLNSLYVEHELKPNLVRVQQYIKWQKERIKNWAPKPLVAVEEI
jgi:hypothetical protein